MGESIAGSYEGGAPEGFGEGKTTEFQSEASDDEGDKDSETHTAGKKSEQADIAALVSRIEKAEQRAAASEKRAKASEKRAALAEAEAEKSKAAAEDESESESEDSDNSDSEGSDSE